MALLFLHFIAYSENTEVARGGFELTYFHFPGVFDIPGLS